MWSKLEKSKTITYSKRGGITMEHIREAVEYVFKDGVKNNVLYITDNVGNLSFKIGYMTSNLEGIKTHYDASSIFEVHYNERLLDELDKKKILTKLFGS